MPRHAGPDRRLRPLPRSQVRSDPDEGLLLAVRRLRQLHRAEGVAADRRAGADARLRRVREGAEGDAKRNWKCCDTQATRAKLGTLARAKAIARYLLAVARSEHAGEQACLPSATEWLRVSRWQAFLTERARRRTTRSWRRGAACARFRKPSLPRRRRSSRRFAANADAKKLEPTGREGLRRQTRPRSAEVADRYGSADRADAESSTLQTPPDVEACAIGRHRRSTSPRTSRTTEVRAVSEPRRRSATRSRRFSKKIDALADASRRAAAGDGAERSRRTR